MVEAELDVCLVWLVWPSQCSHGEETERERERGCQDENQETTGSTRPGETGELHSQSSLLSPLSMRTTTNHLGEHFHCSPVPALFSLKSGPSHGDGTRTFYWKYFTNFIQHAAQEPPSPALTTHEAILIFKGKIMFLCITRWLHCTDTLTINKGPFSELLCK